MTEHRVGETLSSERDARFEADGILVVSTTVGSLPQRTVPSTVRPGCRTITARWRANSHQRSPAQLQDPYIFYRRIEDVAVTPMSAARTSSSSARSDVRAPVHAQRVDLRIVGRVWPARLTERIMLEVALIPPAFHDSLTTSQQGLSRSPDHALARA